MANNIRPVSPEQLALLAQYGRDGDTMLAHINPEEAEMLKRMGGRGTINPKTGLLEYAFRDGGGQYYMDMDGGGGGMLEDTYDFGGDFGGGFGNDCGGPSWQDQNVYTPPTSPPVLPPPPPPEYNDFVETMPTLPGPGYDDFVETMPTLPTPIEVEQQPYVPNFGNVGIPDHLPYVDPASSYGPVPGSSVGGDPAGPNYNNTYMPGSGFTGGSLPDGSNDFTSGNIGDTTGLDTGPVIPDPGYNEANAAYELAQQQAAQQAAYEAEIQRQWEAQQTAAAQAEATRQAELAAQQEAQRQAEIAAQQEAQIKQANSFLSMFKREGTTIKALAAQYNVKSGRFQNVRQLISDIVMVGFSEGAAKRIVASSL